MTGVCVGIEGNMWLLDVDDVILLDKTESVNDIKIGDSVEFLEYIGISKWEAKYGIDVGDVVTVTGLDGNCVRSPSQFSFSRSPEAIIPRSSFNRSFGLKTTFDARLFGSNLLG